MAKAKKTKATTHTLSPWYLGWGFLSVALIAPIVLLSKNVWMLNPKAPFLPLNAEIFTNLYPLFGGYRIALPEQLSPPALFVFTYLPLFLLGLLFFVIRRIDFGKNLHPNLVAFCITCALSPLARPGLSIANLWEVFLNLIFVVPLIQPISGVWIWAVGNIGILAAAIREDLRPVLIWAVISLLLATTLNFLLVERLRIHRNQKKKFFAFSTRTIGLMCFGLWILLLTASAPLSSEYFGTSDHYAMALIGGAFAVLLAYLCPWETKRWLAIATFLQGLLIFKTLFTPALILCVYLGIRLIGVGIASLSKPKSTWVVPSIRWSLVIAGLAFIYVIYTRPSAPRALPSEWVDILDQLEEKSYFVYGSGWPVVSQFSRSKFVENEDWMLEKSEEAWKEHLESIQATQLIVHVDSAKALWSRWIASGKNADEINQSMISRLIVYKGEGLKTPTLKINPVKNFKIEPLSEKSEIVLIKLIAS